MMFTVYIIDEWVGGKTSYNYMSVEYPIIDEPDDLSLDDHIISTPYRLDELGDTSPLVYEHCIVTPHMGYKIYTIGSDSNNILTTQITLMEYSTDNNLELPVLMYRILRGGVPYVMRITDTYGVGHLRTNVSKLKSVKFTELRHKRIPYRPSHSFSGRKTIAYSKDGVLTAKSIEDGLILGETPVLMSRGFLSRFNHATEVLRYDMFLRGCRVEIHREALWGGVLSNHCKKWYKTIAVIYSQDEDVIDSILLEMTGDEVGVDLSILEYKKL